MPVTVNTICAVEVIPFILTKLEVMDVHDHDEQLNVLGTVNDEGMVTYMYEGVISDDGVTVICKVVAYPYTRDENWP